MAKWDTSLLGEPRVRIRVFSTSDIYLRPVKIVCFIKVPYSVGDQLFSELLCKLCGIVLKFGVTICLKCMVCTHFCL